MLSLTRTVSVVTFTVVIALLCSTLTAQVKWTNTNANYAPLPAGINVYKTSDSMDGKAFKAVYAIVDLNDLHLNFTTDTTLKRRLTPAQFFEKNGQPLLVVNTSFFSFGTNQNLNIIIKDGKLVSYNVHALDGRGKDTLTYRHTFSGALGISKKRRADVAWIYSDSAQKNAYASQQVITAFRDSVRNQPFKNMQQLIKEKNPAAELKKWKMQTAVGGGPVLVQNGQLKITNEEELKFTGKAISDLHPRTIMGYTEDNHLIIMAIEGRNKGVAEGATLLQCARLMIELGCTEALNLDGGGSSCLLINGKETIYPSDKGLQRPVPAVFIINVK